MTFPQLSSANRVITSSGTSSYCQVGQSCTHSVDIVLGDFLVHTPHLRYIFQLLSVSLLQDRLLNRGDI